MQTMKTVSELKKELLKNNQREEEMLSNIAPLKEKLGIIYEERYSLQNTIKKIEEEEEKQKIIFIYQTLGAFIKQLGFSKRYTTDWQIMGEIHAKDDFKSYIKIRIENRVIWDNQELIDILRPLLQNCDDAVLKLYNKYDKKCKRYTNLGIIHESKSWLALPEQEIFPFIPPYGWIDR